MVVRLILLFAVLYQTRGQTIYSLRNDGLYSGTARILQDDFSSSRVSMCYNGESIFIAEGIVAASPQAIIHEVTLSPSTTSSVYQTIDDTFNVAIDCCCKYVAVGYPDAATRDYKIRLYTDKVGISLDFKIEDPDLQIASLNIDCTAETIRLVTQETIYTFNILNSGDPPTEEPFENPLIALPRCSALFTDSDAMVTYLFTSYGGREEVEVIQLTSPFTPMRRTFENDGNTLSTYCLDVDGNNLHSFSFDSTSVMGHLITIEAADVVSGTNIPVNPTASTFLPNIGDFVNGISVCDTCPDDLCLSETCTACDTDPDFSQCGFCSPDLTECVCGNPLEAGCEYEDGDLRESCIRPTPKLDATCMVHNPVADRRKPGNVAVAVAVSPTESNYGSAEIRRAVKTGRWSSPPRSTMISVNSILREGFTTALQSNARGRRFGFFAADLLRTDNLEETIYCIATEKSGFRNKVFTYTTVEGGSVTMDVDLDNMKYLDEVRWRRRDVSTGAVTPLKNGRSLSLTLTSVTKAQDEGVYEVYRIQRDLRTWHPIIYLFVRTCAVDRYGTDCVSPCGSCGNGICDEITGDCRCYPGFTGPQCEETCDDAKLVGQNCDIDCDVVFGVTGSECRNMEICYADELGCGCRSGLEHPDCVPDCPTNTWGTNCGNTCECSGEFMCDPRQGCIPPGP